MVPEPTRRDGTSFKQFCASLGNEVARAAIGLPMSDSEAARVLSSEPATRELYDRWLADVAGTHPPPPGGRFSPRPADQAQPASPPTVDPRYAGQPHPWDPRGHGQHASPSSVTGHALTAPAYYQGPAGYFQGPTGYYQGPTGYYQVAPPTVRPTSSWAVAGFICSLLWGFGFLSIVGLFLSGHAWRTETARGLRGGHGLAVAGVILGAVGSVPAVLVVLAYFVSLFQGG